MPMTFEACHRLAAEAVSLAVAALILLLLCARAGAAIRAEPSTAAARNLESIVILLGCCLTCLLTRGWAKGFTPAPQKRRGRDRRAAFGEREGGAGAGARHRDTWKSARRGTSPRRRVLRVTPGSLKRSSRSSDCI